MAFSLESIKRVFIANFGQENHLWPSCLDRSTVATFEAEDLRPFWLAGDRDGYIAHCIATKKTARGITPTRPVASRWFNLGHIISDTEGDLWVHREKDELWWTISLSGEVNVSLEPAFKSTRENERIYVLHKPAKPWSNQNRHGNPLSWRALHPKAREFLFTEGTLQQLADGNAAYARALINGDNLNPWYSLPAWNEKAAAAQKNPATIFSAKQRAVYRMVQTVRDTVANANGQREQRTIKNKELRFATEQDLGKYIEALVEAQDGLCAITGLRFQFDGECDDYELLCSLDRIDSDGHYEAGNLQIVCRFVNRWKSDGNDFEFRRLISLVRNSGASGY